MRGKTTRLILLLSLLINFLSPQYQANAEECPTYDLQSIFFEEFYGQKWDNSSGSLEISWSPNGTIIKDERIVRAFTETEQIWLREAFDGWDDALSTVSFKETSNPQEAKILIGLVPLTELKAIGYWNTFTDGVWRNSATIRLKAPLEHLKRKDSFIGLVLHELGNALGLGDVKQNSGMFSVQTEPHRSYAPLIPLGLSDVGMIRQLYGESTCPSTFTPTYKLATESIAKREAEALAANQLKWEKAAAEIKAQEEADALLWVNAAAPLKKTSITCVKKNAIKTVTSTKPKCPKGYVKKK